MVANVAGHLAEDNPEGVAQAHVANVIYVATHRARSESEPRLKVVRPGDVVEPKHP
jgi:hypothetical protein